MRHNFTDKKIPKPQPDTTLTDHSVRTELPKSAGQWGKPSPAEPGIKVVRVPCKKETGTTERGRGSPSTRTPPMSGSGTDRQRGKKKNEATSNFFQSRLARLCPPKNAPPSVCHFISRSGRFEPCLGQCPTCPTPLQSSQLSCPLTVSVTLWIGPKSAHDPASEFHFQQFHNEKGSGGSFLPTFLLVIVFGDILCKELAFNEVVPSPAPRGLLSNYA